MNRDKIDNLIAQLEGIRNTAKDIHYNCTGENFYGNHLLADRCANGLSEYIDQLKEICLLGHGYKPLLSSEYLKRAVGYIPEHANFNGLKTLLINTLKTLESVNNISKGDENLLGAIAQDIQNNVGLINIMYGDIK